MAGALSEIRRTQLAFWTAFSKPLSSSSFALRRPAARNWCYLPIGTSAAKVILAVSFRDGRVECKLAVGSSGHGAPSVNARAVVDRLVSDRAAIEQELGFSDLVWGDPTSTRIYRRSLMAVQDRRVWPEAFYWLIESAERFKAAFGPRVSRSVRPASPTTERPTAETPSRPLTPGHGFSQRESGPKARAPAPTICALLESIGAECDLAIRSGTWPKTPELPDGASWLALYSTEKEPVYRYAFALWWGEQTPEKTAAWVLLNPATGDTNGKPRPILTACRHRSSSWGRTALVIVNLFAYRDGNPKQLIESSAVGPHNNRVLKAITGACDLTVAAWGAGGAKWQRSTTVRPWLDHPQCLPKNGTLTTLSGEPFYPKGIGLNTQLVPLPEPSVPVP